MRTAIKQQQNRVYLNLTSHVVRDDFHVTQCYQCQAYGHKSGSSHCSGIQVCMYCSKSHASSECPVKDDKSKHVCANCKMHPDFKDQAHSHNCGSHSCPVYLKELETVIKKTAGMSSNDFLFHKKRLCSRQKS